MLSTPNLAAWYNRALLLAGVQPVFSEVSLRAIHGRPGREVVGHLRLYTARALREFVAASGFEVVRLRGRALPRRTAPAAPAGPAGLRGPVGVLDPAAARAKDVAPCGGEWPRPCWRTSCTAPDSSWRSGRWPPCPRSTSAARPACCGWSLGSPLWIGGSLSLAAGFGAQLAVYRTLPIAAAQGIFVSGLVLLVLLSSRLLGEETTGRERYALGAILAALLMVVLSLKRGLRHGQPQRARRR